LKTKEQYGEFGPPLLSKITVTLMKMK